MEFELFGLEITELKFPSVRQPPDCSFLMGWREGVVSFLGLSFLFRPVKRRVRASGSGVSFQPYGRFRSQKPLCRWGPPAELCAGRSVGNGRLSSGSPRAQSGVQFKLWL